MTETAQTQQTADSTSPWRPRDWKTEGPLKLEDLTDDEVLFLLSFEDDTEESPWMSMGYPQFWAVSEFAVSLRAYAHIQGIRWFVAGMLPILWPIPGSTRTGRLSPDVYVVPGKDERPLSSYDLRVEGVFPPFVLEVLSPESIERDIEDKRSIYERLGAREYVLFAPTPDLKQPSLQGFHREGNGDLVPWKLEESGRLFSEELELWLVAEGMELRGERPDGQRLFTAEEAENERRREREARQRAEEARLAAEAEVDRLRAEIFRLRAEQE